MNNSNTPEQRIVEFVEHLKSSGRIRFFKEFFDKVGIRRQYYVAVRKGNNRFTTNQISNICKSYKNLNANWIFGTESNMLKH